MAYPNLGNIKRAKPRMQILRGNDAGESSMESAAHPVKSDVTIKSGMVISPAWQAGESRYEWVLGLTGGVGYFATADSEDQDVISAGKLVGLSCTGKYEITTGYYNDADTYNLHAYLTGNASGEVEEVTLGGTAGSGPVIGRISRVFPAAPAETTGVPKAATQGGAGYSVDSGATDATVVCFETISIPQNGV